MEKPTCPDCGSTDIDGLIRGYVVRCDSEGNPIGEAFPGDYAETIINCHDCTNEWELE